MGQVGEQTTFWEPTAALCRGGQDIPLTNSPAPPSPLQAGGHVSGATAASHMFPALP